MYLRTEMILEWGCGSQGIIVLPILFKILTYGLHTHTHTHIQEGPTFTTLGDDTNKESILSSKLPGLLYQSQSNLCRVLNSRF